MGLNLTETRRRVAQHRRGLWEVGWQSILARPNRPAGTLSLFRKA